MGGVAVTVAASNSVDSMLNFLFLSGHYFLRVSAALAFKFSSLYEVHLANTRLCRFLCF